MIDAAARAPRRARSSARGAVRAKELRTENAFDIGGVAVGELELGFVNEYLTAESGGERLATFPDVLATISPADRADHLDRRHRRRRRGRRAARARRRNVPLGDGVKEPSVYPEVEAMLGKPLAEYALAGPSARIAERLEALWADRPRAGRRRRPSGVLPRRGVRDAAGRRVGGAAGLEAGDRRPRQPVGAAARTGTARS